MSDDLLTKPSALSEHEVEEIELVTMRWIFQATIDFGIQPFFIFQHSPDKVGDIAEDVTREILDRLSGYNIEQRVFGNVDYKKARYIILPNRVVRQALFVDSKAEKSGNTGTLQMSQLSMNVHQHRLGTVVNEPGKLPPISRFDAEEFLTTTMLLHYEYEDAEENYLLRAIRICAIPNGLLQARYNPSPDDTIWRAGRNAPSRGEDFRVRLHFKSLKKKATWRVQTVTYTPESINWKWTE